MEGWAKLVDLQLMHYMARLDLKTALVLLTGLSVLAYSIYTIGPLLRAAASIADGVKDALHAISAAARVVITFVGGLFSLATGHTETTKVNPEDLKTFPAAIALIVGLGTLANNPPNMTALTE